jgi:hypothetical protein
MKSGYLHRKKILKNYEAQLSNSLILKNEIKKLKKKI